MFGFEFLICKPFIFLSLLSLKKMNVPRNSQLFILSLIKMKMIKLEATLQHNSSSIIISIYLFYGAVIWHEGKK